MKKVIISILFFACSRFLLSDDTEKSRMSLRGIKAICVSFRWVVDMPIKEQMLRKSIEKRLNRYGIKTLSCESVGSTPSKPVLTYDIGDCAICCHHRIALKQNVKTLINSETIEAETWAVSLTKRSNALDQEALERDLESLTDY